MSARAYRFVTANTNNLQQIPGSAQKLIGASLINTAATVFYVKFWWFDPIVGGAQGPTVGTTAPDLVIAVPPLDAATGAVGSVVPSWPTGVLMGMTPLWVACVTGSADSDNTAVASGQGNINLLLE
jgi:hypothetical protein